MYPIENLLILIRHDVSCNYVEKPKVCSYLFKEAYASIIYNTWLLKKSRYFTLLILLGLYTLHELFLFKHEIY